MSKFKQQPKEEHLDYLRELVNNKFSQNICNKYDCSVLEDAIFKETNKRVSVDTLRRLFKVLVSKSLPSTYTLNVCAIYVGFNSWENLIDNYSEQNTRYQKAFLFDVIENNVNTNELILRINKFSKSKDLYETFNQIILFKWQTKDTHFFTKIFEIKSIFNFHESFQYDIYHTIHLLGSLCKKTKWLKNIAVNYYYNLPFKFDYFTEWLVVPEYTYYIELIENYYQAKKKDKNSVLFYNLILSTYYAENKNIDLFLKHYKVLKKTNTEKLNNIIAMRWLGLQLFYEKQFNNSKYLPDVLDTILNNFYVNEKDAGNRVSSIFIICQYLYIVEEYQTIVTLFEEKSKLHSNILGFWAELNYNQLKVYYAFSALKTNKRADAEFVFAQIDATKFDLNFKTKMNIIYEKLQKEILKNKLNQKKKTSKRS